MWYKIHLQYLCKEALQFPWSSVMVNKLCVQHPDKQVFTHTWTIQILSTWEQTFYLHHCCQANTINVTINRDPSWYTRSICPVFVADIFVSYITWKSFKSVSVMYLNFSKQYLPVSVKMKNPDCKLKPHSISIILVQGKLLHHTGSPKPELLSTLCRKGEAVAGNLSENIRITCKQWCNITVRGMRY